MEISMEEANKSGFVDTINELVSIKCCGTGIKEEESQNFAVEGDAKDLMSKIRKVRVVGSNATEMFLLELLINADQALFSVWRKSSVDKNKYGDPPCLGIGIFPDEKNKTLSIIDTGIGINRNDLARRLLSLDFFSTPHLSEYMIAAERYSANVDLPDLYKRESRLGFFSAYMVAYKVVITTKEEGHDPYVWELNANDNGAGGSNLSFSVAPAACSFRRGTKVTLHLNDCYLEYLRVDKLQELVKKCEQFKHSYPIFLILDNPVFRLLLLNKENEEEKVPIEKLKDKYKGVQESFVEHIRDRAKNVDVVITDCPWRVTCDLNVFEDGRKPVLEINSRCPDMEKLRELLEYVKLYDLKLKKARSLPKGEEKKRVLRLYKNKKKKKEATLKRRILLLLTCALIKFSFYDTLFRTSFYSKAAKAIGLGDEWWWRSLL